MFFISCLEFHYSGIVSLLFPAKAIGWTSSSAFSLARSFTTYGNWSETSLAFLVSSDFVEVVISAFVWTYVLSAAWKADVRLPYLPQASRSALSSLTLDSAAVGECVAF